MKIETRNVNNNICSVYKINKIYDRKSAIIWILTMWELMPLDQKKLRIDDGKSYHDGTISNAFVELPDIHKFVEEYLNSQIYCISIFAYYERKLISLQVHLDLQKVYLEGQIGSELVLETLEQVLGLTE